MVASWLDPPTPSPPLPLPLLDLSDVSSSDSAPAPDPELEVRPEPVEEVKEATDLRPELEGLLMDPPAEFIPKAPDKVDPGLD